MKALCTNACFMVRQSLLKPLIPAYLDTLKAKLALWRIRQSVSPLTESLVSLKHRGCTMTRVIQQHDGDYEIVLSKRKMMLVKSG